MKTDNKTINQIFENEPFIGDDSYINTTVLPISHKFNPSEYLESPNDEITNDWKYARCMLPGCQNLIGPDEIHPILHGYLHFCNENHLCLFTGTWHWH